MDSLFRKPGFNSEAKFGLHLNCVVSGQELASFALFRSLAKWNEFKQVAKDFKTRRRAFCSANLFDTAWSPQSVKEHKHFIPQSDSWITNVEGER